MPKCPRCQSEKVVRNGYIHNGTPKYAGKECRRQFVEKPTQKRISDETKALVDKRLLERVSLAGIVRVSRVSARWLQDYVNRRYQAQPQQVDIPALKKAG
jgi:insertion element IS1 protein InsB